MKRSPLSWVLLATILLFVLAVGYASYIHATARILPEDDAYITYRYVRNARNGQGLVYNPGERVFGISTPLYAVWLFGLQSLCPSYDLPQLAVRTNLIWYLASAVTLTFLLNTTTRSKPVAILGGVIAAANPTMLDISVGGMEPFMFAFLVLAGLAALARNRPRISALFLGLSAICRPEGLMAGFVWLCWWFWYHRDDRVALIIAAAPLLCWLVFSLAYYGTPVPHSLIAKKAPLYLVSAPEATLVLVSTVCLSLVPPALRETNATLGVLVGIWGIVTAIWAVVRLESSWRCSTWIPVLSVPALIAGLYCTEGVRLFPWYLPILWLLCLTLMLSAASIVLARVSSWPRWVLAMPLLAAASVPTLWLLTATITSRGPIPAETAYRLRVEAYRRAAATVVSVASPSASVMASEIGALGYYYPGYVNDAAGLVSPSALIHLPIPSSERSSPVSGAVRLAYVQEALPDFVVAMPSYTQHTLQESQWFRDHYISMGTVALPRVMALDSFVEIYMRITPS